MQWLSLLLMYLPVVLQTVTAVEGSIQNAPGVAKKQVAMDIITTIAGAGTQFPEQHVQQISSLVDSVVGAFNKSGVFTSKATAAK